MSHKFIILVEDKDNCGTSLEDIAQGSEVKIDEKIIKIHQDIPLGHKFALEKIEKGKPIFKYGQIIGIATKDISRGDWIHTHNIKSHYLQEEAS